MSNEIIAEIIAQKHCLPLLPLLPLLQLQQQLRQQQRQQQRQQRQQQKQKQQLEQQRGPRLFHKTRRLFHPNATHDKRRISEKSIMKKFLLSHLLKIDEEKCQLAV